MDYEDFDIGNFEDKNCVKILNTLQIKPMTATELASAIFDDVYKVHLISTRLQKMKRMGLISNVKDCDNVCYWGLQKTYRRKNG